MAEKIPILFACSGCSNTGQLANDVALELNRRGVLSGEIQDAVGRTPHAHASEEHGTRR